MFRPPASYKALRPFTANGASFEAGQVLTSAQLVGLDLGVLVSQRYLVPNADPYARRGDPAKGWGVTYVPGKARPAVAVSAADDTAVEEVEKHGRRRRGKQASASKVAAEGQDGPASS